MGEYSGSAEVAAPAVRLFGYLSEVRNLPRYFTAMTSAEPAGQDAVRVVADLNGATREGEAWSRRSHHETYKFRRMPTITESDQPLMMVACRTA